MALFLPLRKRQGTRLSCKNLREFSHPLCYQQSRTQTFHCYWGGILLVVLPMLIVPSYSFSFRCSQLVQPPAVRTILRASVEPASVSTGNAFRLVQSRDSVELQTATYKVTPRPKVQEKPQALPSAPSRLRENGKSSGNLEIVLVSMVHLADREYYTDMMIDASSYDRVLFELIAGPDVSKLDESGRRTVTEYLYPTQEQEALARNYGLAPQLNCLNYCHLCKERSEKGNSPRWVLADLDRDEVQSLQRAAGEKEIGEASWRGLLEEVTRALVVGRQAGDKILPKFFPPLGSSLNRPALVLRALLWLTPCPEAEIMLLDWARTYPRAGGLSILASAIAESALAGDFFTARKLGFAQQMVSGQAGGGNWGQSDEVVVKARNAVVVEETERAISDGCRKIMIMYGGLHMQDLASQLCRRLDATREPTGWRSAWVVPTRARSRRKTTVAPVDGAADSTSREGQVGIVGDEGGDVVTQWGPLAVAALAYVAVGAWDWTDTVEALARELTSGETPAEALGSAFVVSVLYVARHAYLYYGLARWLVQWEKRLF